MSPNSADLPGEVVPEISTLKKKQSKLITHVCLCIQCGRGLLAPSWLQLICLTCPACTPDFNPTLRHLNFSVIKLSNWVILLRLSVFCIFGQYSKVRASASSGLCGCGLDSLTCPPRHHEHVVLSSDWWKEVCSVSVYQMSPAHFTTMKYRNLSNQTENTSLAENSEFWSHLS